MFNRFILLSLFLFSILVLGMALRIFKSEFDYVMQFVVNPQVSAGILGILSIFGAFVSVKMLLKNK